MFINLKPKSKKEELTSGSISISEEVIKDIISEEDEVEEAVDNFLRDYEKNFFNQDMVESKDVKTHDGSIDTDFSKMLLDGSEESTITGGFDAKFRSSFHNASEKSSEAAQHFVEQLASDLNLNEIQERRLNNKGNIYYPKVYFVADDLVQVSIGDYEEVVTLKEALEKYKYNENAMAELEFLMNSRERFEYTTELTMEDTAEDIIFIR